MALPRWIYGLTIVLSAMLLFSVEPMFTRMLLPWLGGSSAVWISALAFFQVALLLGYLYAASLAPAAERRPQLSGVHLVLLATSVLSLYLPGLHASSGATEHPQRQLFLLLFTSVGLPFITLSTTAPLLQAWYAQRERRSVPYCFFGLSNLASLAALLAYPAWLEPRLELGRQWHVWKWGYLLYAVLAGALSIRMQSAEPASSQPEAELKTPETGRIGLWLALPAVASLQLASVSAHLTQDLAPMPLLWVVPLAAYLLSFVLAFEFPQFYSRVVVMRLLAVLLFALSWFHLQVGLSLPLGLSVAFYTAELGLACWCFHAELYALRPTSAGRSSRFYLAIALGGAMGTILVAVVSPRLTSSNFDLPFSFVCTAGAILWITWTEGWGARLLWGAGSLAGVWLLFTLNALYSHDAIFRGRNFYGTLRVKESQYPPQAVISRTLYNGSIQHGLQWFSDDFRRRPLTYYAANSGAGLAFAHCCGTGPRRVGVVGLGAGTLAAYGRGGDAFRFYEINPMVTDVAQHLFTYTRETQAAVTIVPDDARLSLAREPSQGFDVLAVDAFSGDSIPVHLLTREALDLYLRHLAPGGVLLFHISNQYVDLAPVLARLVESYRGQLYAAGIESAEDKSRGILAASWVLISRSPALFSDPEINRRARPLRLQEGISEWTDQYSSLLPVVRWTGKKASR